MSIGPGLEGLEQGNSNGTMTGEILQLPRPLRPTVPGIRSPPWTWAGDHWYVRVAVPRPNKWTFEIREVRNLVSAIVGTGAGWCEPYRGHSRLPCEFTNDLNVSVPAGSHMDAGAFCESLPYGLEGAVVDPPWSPSQVSRSYAEAGLKATSLDTSSNFHSRVRIPLSKRIRPAGRLISLNFRGTGFGRNNGFQLEAVMTVVHPYDGHNAFFLTVEKKIVHSLLEYGHGP